MSNDRIRYRLRNTDSQLSTDTDTFIKLNLEGSRRLLPKNEINETVNSAEVFNNERQSSKKYRVLGTIKPLASNVLFNLTSNYNTTTDFSTSESYGWSVFNDTKFRLDPIDSFNDDTGQYTGLTYPQAYKTFLKEKDGWFGFYNPDVLLTGNCEFYTMEPKKERFSFKPTSNKKWELTLTYPFSADTTHFLVVNGLKIIGHQTVSVGGRDRVVFSTPVRHNLKQGDLVNITGLNPSGLDGFYRVLRTGLDDGSMTEYYFSVDIDPTTINNVTTTYFRRVLGGTQNGFQSRYYLRLFKKITTVNTNINNGIVEDDDYEIYQAAFSHTIFNDEVCQFVFNEDIDVGNIRDNLGRPISEMFLTIVKTRDNSFFTPIQAGLECGLVNGIIITNTQNPIPDIRQLRDGPNGLSNYNDSPVPLTSNVTINDDYFYGDIVEYNDYELIENVLGVVGHRFNTEDRISDGIQIGLGCSLGITNAKCIAGPRHEGYFYYPHHRIKVRDFSTYIEQGNSNTIGIPDYALDLGDGRWLWRDLLDIGVNDGQEETLNYPFLNGAHYMYQNFCFPVRRQDPYGQYDLYYGYETDQNGQTNYEPYDIVGVGITNNFDVNSAEDAC
jgi:hypothetical protein